MIDTVICYVFIFILVIVLFLVMMALIFYGGVILLGISVMI